MCASRNGSEHMWPFARNSGHCNGMHSHRLAGTAILGLGFLALTYFAQLTACLVPAWLCTALPIMPVSVVGNSQKD